jgi:hypothetical protein
MSKLSEKEIAYKNGRHDERKKIIDTLEQWQSKLITDSKDMDETNRYLLAIFIEHIELKVTELRAKL